MFERYKMLVLQKYQQKVSDDRTFSPNLVNPTPAKVKAECIQVCEERFLKIDEGVLRIIFRQHDGPAAYRTAIKQRDTDTFKPLCNFLKGGTTNTEEKNVELLAWLIDFEPRPYANWRNSIKLTDGDNFADSARQEENSEDPDDLTTGEGLKEKTDVFSGDQTSKPENFQLQTTGIKNIDGLARSTPRKTLLFMCLSAITCIGAYIIAGHISGDVLSSKAVECMYWDEDHYQPVPCNKKIDGLPVYALDTAKVSHLRKINMPDTLTRMAIGTVWYSKIDGNVEFFTSGGFHPIVTTRRLKPVTELIINKYARQQAMVR